MRRDKSVELPQRQTDSSSALRESVSSEPHTLSKFKEEELLLLLVERHMWFRETGRKLEYSLVGTGESVTFLTEENVWDCVSRIAKLLRDIQLTIVDPIFGEGEALPKTTVLVCLGKQPGRVHKVLATEESCNFLFESKSEIRRQCSDRQAQE